MIKSVIQSKKNSKSEKSFLNVDELDMLVQNLRSSKTRGQRSCELEQMTIKMKDLKYFSKEDVEELREIHADDWRFKFHFSQFWDHIPKMIVFLFAMCLWIYWFGWFITLVAFLPLNFALFIIVTFVRLSKG